MSHFGDGAFEQVILDWVKVEMRKHNANMPETVKALSQMTCDPTPDGAKEPLSGPEQLSVGLTEHCTFRDLHRVDLAFGLAIAPTIDQTRAPIPLGRAWVSAAMTPLDAVAHRFRPRT